MTASPGHGFEEFDHDREDMKDLCLNCGAELESALFGAKCSCTAPNVVHQNRCSGCGRIVGQITDDDYCEPMKLYCPDCMDKGRNDRVEGRDAASSRRVPSHDGLEGNGT